MVEDFVQKTAKYKVKLKPRQLQTARKDGILQQILLNETDYKDNQDFRLGFEI